MNLNNDFCKLVFPKGVCEWFDLTFAEDKNDIIYLTLEEKDLPPLTEDNKYLKIIDKKIHNVTITDFPIRGKRTELTFRRRYWKLEGQKEYLKRDLSFAFPGTQLEKEFSVFLKEASRDVADLAGYLGYTKPPADKTV